MKVSQRVHRHSHFWHLQGWPCFFKSRFSGSDHESAVRLQRCCNGAQNTEHTPPKTYSKHTGIGSRRKKLEQFSDFRYFFQSTVWPYKGITGFPGIYDKNTFFAKCWANRSRGSQSRIRNIFCFSVCSMSIFQGKIQFCTIASVCKEIFSSIDFPLRIRPKICCTYLESVCYTDYLYLIFWKSENI